MNARDCTLQDVAGVRFRFGRSFRGAHARQGRWKLVSRHRERWELYAVEADRTEMNNLADAQPERTKTMIAAHARWAERCGVVQWGTIPKEYQN
jgi:arylsulfatase A-like enzyme